MNNSGTISPGDELLWRPKRRLLLDHHLFTEEEVFKYCVENDFVFPGYEKDDGGHSIVFVASELGKPTKILSELHMLEYLWVRALYTPFVSPFFFSFFLLLL
jgi:hypothetical protein